jgi:RNA polymerase sigma-70 factor (ECF subfamily)
MEHKISVDYGNFSKYESYFENRPFLKSFKVNETSEHEKEIFDRFLSGDDSAFLRLYELHNQRIFIYCVKIINDTAASKDITHSVWEKIIGLRDKTMAIENPAGFMLRIARNLCRDYERHRRFQRKLTEVSESEYPVVLQSELTSEEEIVIEALKMLPEQTREILVLHYYSGYSFQEIAGMLGKSPNAIWTRVSRAREALKLIIEKSLKAAHNLSKIDYAKERN